MATRLSDVARLFGRPIFEFGRDRLSCARPRAADLLSPDSVSAAFLFTVELRNQRPIVPLAAACAAITCHTSPVRCCQSKGGNAVEANRAGGGARPHSDFVATMADVLASAAERTS